MFILLDFLLYLVVTLFIMSFVTPTPLTDTGNVLIPPIGIRSASQPMRWSLSPTEAV